MLLNIQIESISLAQPEKALKKVSEEKENVLKKAEMEKELIILQNARKMKAKNISDDIIAECTGLSLQKIQEL